MNTVSFKGVGLFERADSVEAGKRIMRLLLEALIQANEIYLREHPETPLLYGAGVHYEREPRGIEDWCGIAEVRARGWGDCEDLAAWRAAELRVRFGIPAVCTFTDRLLPGNLLMFHILTQLPDGRVEDPSRKLGMGSIV